MSVVSNYARALANVQASTGGENGQRSKNFSTLLQEVEAVDHLLSSSRELQLALGTPVTTQKEKASISQEVCKKTNVGPLVQKFVLLLCRTGRIRYLKDILGALKKIQIESEGGMLGQVLSADHLSADEVAELEKTFSKKVGKKVAFSVREDAALLAGLKVFVNGRTYDSSLQGQLERLRRALRRGVTQHADPG